jgi:hypothetical protein
LPRKPGPYGGEDFHLSTLLLPPGFALLIGPPDLSARLLPNQNASLPTQPITVVLLGIGS